MSEISFLKLQSSIEGSHDRRVIVAPGNPGGVAFLGPSLECMAHDPDLDVLIMANPLGQKKLGENPALQLEPVPHSVLDSYNPHVIVGGVEVDEIHQTRLRARFPDASTILAEDNYGAAGYHLERGFRPDRILTFNQVARDAIANAYENRVPNLAGRIEVTGHPALDSTLDDNLSAERRKTLREDYLGLSEEDKLLVCFATIGEVELVRQFATELARTPLDNLKVAFNAHPRDSVKSPEYWRIFEEAGVPFYRTDDSVDYSSLVSAADAVAILPQSTAASHAIHRAPTIYVQAEYADPTIYQTPVAYGASPLVTPADFMPALERLMDSTNPQINEMHENAKKLYPWDKQSALRVATSIGRTANISFWAQAA